MDRIRILYFLEDRAQEGFIKALVERVAREESVSVNSLTHDIRSSRGGSRVISEFDKFMEDTIKVSPSEVDLLIVAIDGNCKGHTKRVRQLEKAVKAGHPLRDRIVYAVPDPHIERWYIIDQRAFKNGIGIEHAPEKPAYKCTKNYYKNIINQALMDSDVDSLLTGAEYAENIVDKIESLDALNDQNAGFDAFVKNLRAFFRSAKEA